MSETLRITLKSADGTAQAVYGNIALAESKKYILLDERGYACVTYFPASDVRQALLIPSAKTTYCPFKGIAYYWSFKMGTDYIRNCVWSYLDPIPSMHVIAGYFSFTEPLRVISTKI